MSLVYSCTQNAVTMNQAKRDINVIHNEVLAGDTNAYHELRTIYLDEYTGDFLFWAIYMSNRFGYSEASYDVFYILTVTPLGWIGNVTHFDSLDAETKGLAMNYLRRAADGGHLEAKDILKELE